MGHRVGRYAATMSAGEPGQVVVRGATWELGAEAHGIALGPIQVKGQPEVVDARRRLDPPA
jgi:hypothetical protein